MIAHRLLQLVAILALYQTSWQPARGASDAPSCAVRVTVLARALGSPDDIALSGSRVLISDIDRGTLSAYDKGRVRILVSHLQGPEGIVVRSPTSVVIAEQRANRLLALDLKHHTRRVVLRLHNTSGREGVDGLAPAPGGGIYVPDSPNGRVYLLDGKERLHLIAGGLGRPVGAVAFRGGVAVPDETDNAIWLIRPGRVSRLATVSIPDDVVVFKGRLLAVSLGDGRLWQVWPSLRALGGPFRSPQGLAAIPGMGVIVADEKAGALYRVSGLSGCMK